MASPRGVKFNFSVGEKVLCYEPDPNKAKVLYDSKILECCVKGKKSIEYLVHFYGWNSSWDRHVAEHNILRNNQENRHLQRQLAEQAAESLKGKKLKLNKIPAIIKEVVVGNNINSCSGNNSDGDSAESNSNQNKDLFEDGEDECQQDTGDEDNSMFRTTIVSSGGYVSDNVLSEQSQSNDCVYQQQPTFIIQIPEDLKAILEQDHENVDASKCIYNLPADVTVKDILEEYGKKVAQKQPAEIVSSGPEELQRFVLLKEFVNSIEVYFNAILKDYLLYNDEEREQMEDLVHLSPDKPFSKIYGLIHLLRMMTILPEFLSVTSMPKKQLKTVKSMCEHFLVFLSENKELFIC